MAFFKRKKKKKKQKESQAGESAQAVAEAVEASDSEPDRDTPAGPAPSDSLATDDRDVAEPAPEPASPTPEAEAVAEPAPEPEEETTPTEPEPKPEASSPTGATEGPGDQAAQGESEPVTGEDTPQPEEEPEKEQGEADVDKDGDTTRKGLFGRLKNRLGKTRDKISGSIDRMTFGKQIDEDTLDELEEVLVTADLGVATTMELIDGLRGKVKRKELTDAEALKTALQQSIGKLLAEASSEPVDRTANNPHVIMVVGVNGVGKTTTIGKLAHRFTGEGRKVLLAAGDTFRAAAAEQLSIWSERTGAPIVKQQHGADPSAVAYDAVDAAINRERDLLLIDTAGRLQTKVNLMEELKKIHRVVGKRLEGAPHEVLLVLDATTGQNALSQARLFNEAVKVSGVVLTKLDGTAKGGIVVAIASELKLPIHYVGLGEGIDDLRPFDPEDFARAIF